MERKILVLSYNAFSDSNANGRTLAALLDAFDSKNLIQFYRGNDPQNYDFAHSYFHITDKEMLQTFFLKKCKNVYDYDENVCINQALCDDKITDKALSNNILKRNHDYKLRFIREILWIIAPWGKKVLYKWLEREKPECIFYMVGESFFDDLLVLKICHKYKIPLILYNCEGYRLVDSKKRKGIEKIFYIILKSIYKRIHKVASMVIYNCNYLMKEYQLEYKTSQKELVVYNTDTFEISSYVGNLNPNISISYFGNLGVGRVSSLMDIANYLNKYYPSLKVHVYGKPSHDDEKLLQVHPSIEYHGFVSQEKLKEVKETSDILLHVESFEDVIVPKLKYAFSTKIAQCLCSGRCMFAYAPLDMAATEYLIQNDCCVVATTKEEMGIKLGSIIDSAQLRKLYAKKALEIAHLNHDSKIQSLKVKREIEDIL